MARPLMLGVADRVALVDLYRSGHSTWCISRQAGISQPAVRYHLRAADVSMRAQHRGRVAPCCPVTRRRQAEADHRARLASGETT